MGLAIGRNRFRLLEGLAALLLLVVLAAAAHFALSRPVSFDGALNLQVAKSLADGQGYVRSYEGPRPFPVEVQTNVPYVVPAAGVFALFGVGVWQSQVTNLAYLVGLLGLVVLMMRRHWGLGAGLVAALALFCVPGFLWIGMNGWGEVPTLFWWLAGSVLLLQERGRWRYAHVVGAACLGLALATKTVILIGIVSTIAIYTVWLFADRSSGWWGATRGWLRAASAFLLPLLLLEYWRAHAMGWADYSGWWTTQWHAIVSQTGVAGGHAGHADPKLGRHFLALARETGVAAWLLAIWLVLPLLAGLAWVARDITAERTRLLATLLLTAVVYFIWWLMIAPDTHVRLRRIEIGLILVQILWIWHIAAGFQRARASRPWRVAAAASVACFVVASGAFAHSGFTSLSRRWGGDRQEFDQAMARVKGLPAGSILFGKGFLSAPIVGLYADRRIRDIDEYTAGQLARIGSGYILVDPPAAHAHRFGAELRRYPHSLVIDSSALQVYRLDFTDRSNPFNPSQMRSDEALPALDYSRDKNYKLTFGLLGGSRAPWRWARTDAEVLLRYERGKTLMIDATRPNVPYVATRPLTLSVRLDDCALGSRVLAPGRHLLAFPISGNCRPARDSNARVQIQADNMAAPAPLNLQQHGYILAGVRFAD